MSEWSCVVVSCVVVVVSDRRASEIGVVVVSAWLTVVVPSLRMPQVNPHEGQSYANIGFALAKAASSVHAV